MNKRMSPDAAKRAVNLSIDSALLEDAKARGVNLSALFEKALVEDRTRRWLKENADAFAAYNREIEEHGVWSDSVRPW